MVIISVLASALAMTIPVAMDTIAMAIRGTVITMAMAILMHIIIIVGLVIVTGIGIMTGVVIVDGMGIADPGTTINTGADR